MDKTIATLDAGEKQCPPELLRALEGWWYPAIPIHPLKKRKRYIHYNINESVIVDMHTVPADNPAIQKLTKKNPQSFLFFLSQDPFHSHFEEALGSQTFACTHRPIDPEEVICHVNAINTLNAKSDNPPGV